MAVKVQQGAATPKAGGLSPVAAAVAIVATLEGYDTEARRNLPVGLVGGQPLPADHVHTYPAGAGFTAKCLTCGESRNRLAEDERAGWVHGRFTRGPGRLSFAETYAVMVEAGDITGEPPVALKADNTPMSAPFAALAAAVASKALVSNRNGSYALPGTVPESQPKRRTAQPKSGTAAREAVLAVLKGAAK